jgi:tetratricopeptide (TPR) repeat protein
MLRSGRAADALPDADKAVGLLSDLAEAHAGRARVYEALDRTDDAILEYKRALALKLDDPSEVVSALARLESAKK